MPQLLESHINYYLLLDDFAFKDQTNNIQYLNSQAILASDLKITLDFLNQATSIVEKFHSYFHFEQSFFHLQLALAYMDKKMENEAKIELKNAIFQDHSNLQAIALSSNSSSYQEYKRPYQTFSDYLYFATNEKLSVYKENNNSYNYWLDLTHKPSIDLFKTIINKIRYLHLNYHQESAKLYLNRALVFHLLGNFLLSQNDLVKAHNLDSKLKEKKYYYPMLLQMSKPVILGLGSNLGNKIKNLQTAIEKLTDLEILFNIKQSDIEETEALLPPNSPKEWNINYLNMALKGYTRLSPIELLKELKNIEISIGRKESPKWSPREIDIDILAYGDMVYDKDNLSIPHPELLNRKWVLKHFAQIYPEWKYPVAGIYKDKTIKELYEEN